MTTLYSIADRKSTWTRLPDLSKEVNAESQTKTLEQLPKEDEQEKKDIYLGKGLQFITDKNLYDEIIIYLDKTFLSHKGTLSGKLSFDSVMKGSNSYIAVAVDMFLRQQGSRHRIATQRDLETNLQMFKGCYEDTGLALRSTGFPNQSKAEYLHKQIKKLYPQLNFPIFAELRGMELDSDLNFKITPQSRCKTADCLNWDNGTKYSQTDNYGLPKAKDASSSRQIWTIKDGLARLYLNRVLDLDSGDEGLSDSVDDGRVVLVSAGGGSP